MHVTLGLIKMNKTKPNKIHTDGHEPNGVVFFRFVQNFGAILVLETCQTRLEDTRTLVYFALVL